MEAIVAVRKMTLLYPGVADGSRNLVSCLRGRKKRTNAKVGAVAIVGGLAGLYAAGFFFGPAGLAASFLYSWVTAGAASGAALAVGGTVGGVAAVGGAGTLLVKIPWEGGRLENGKLRSDFNTSVPLTSSYLCSPAKETRLPEGSYEAFILLSSLLAGEYLEDEIRGHIRQRERGIPEKPRS